MSASEFDFAYDPSLFPGPAPLPPSADLFSPEETTDLLGFLDNFSAFNWETNDGQNDSNDIYVPMPPPAPYTNPHLGTIPDPSASRTRRSTRSSRAQIHSPDPNGRSMSTTPPSSYSFPNRNTHPVNQPPVPANPPTSAAAAAAAAAAARARPLLSTPQKRLNHIMSEQKRRNAIRDGYAQLISLLAPAGSGASIGMPTRGRPKGSGGRGGKNQTKGKSGVLFRAVEYCRWLEEGRDALREEVRRVEAAAGIMAKD